METTIPPWIAAEVCNVELELPVLWRSSAMGYGGPLSRIRGNDERTPSIMSFDFGAQKKTGRFSISCALKRRALQNPFQNQPSALYVPNRQLLNQKPTITFKTLKFIAQIMWTKR